MKAQGNRMRVSIFWSAWVVCAAVSLACGSGTSTQAEEQSPAAPGNALREGSVLETMDAAGYTYVRVLTDDGEIWAAGPKTAVSVGDKVELPPGSLMTGFKSMALDRTFDEIYFVTSINVAGAAKADVGDHDRTAVDTDAGVGSIEKAEEGVTIAELYARRGEFSGKQVVVRGKVVKYTAGIMGRNWIHIQDGTGEADKNDLTVTTQASVAKGDVVVVRGTVAVDKDFGAGYRYAVIVEDATIEE